ncbi:DAG-kinase catalytic domain protein [Minicystis rosea]|nr:DAG-kinase catalytic domain protein [Minicystis rosea]
MIPLTPCHDPVTDRCMGGIGVVINPRSRQNQRDPRAALRLARTLGDHGVVRTAHNRDDLARIAEDFRRLQIDVLGISGGDGTNYVTITGFLEVWADEPLPPLAFLRGGTFNTVANAVGVPRGRPDGILARLIRRHAAREPLQHVERHVMRIGKHYGFIFGTGAIHGFISDYNKAEVRDALWAAKVLGRASAAVVAGRPTPVAERWEGRVTLDDGDVFPDRDYLAIGAGTVDQIGLGFRPFYRSDHAPGTFHILGIHTTALGFVRKLPDVWHARSMGPDHTYDRITPRAVIEARGGVVRYVCDGDVHEHAGPLTIETGPRVRILVENKTGIRPFGFGS